VAGPTREASVGRPPGPSGSLDDPARAVLYVRVSTRGQAGGGYSLAQQAEALREHEAREGYDVLEEVADAGHSGSSLERPGMARVRDLVAGGGVSAVLVQDTDRLARDPEHYRLLRREFEAEGCRLEVLNDRGAGQEEFARREAAVLAERSMRGKLRKAREGKIVAGHSPYYGFRFNAARDGYEVDEARMVVVRRIFRLVGVAGRSLNHVVRALEADGVPSPSGRGRWLPWGIRRLVLEDVYRPHSFGEIAALVAPEVAARLDPGGRYGVWWFNSERWTSRQVAEASESGPVFRWSVRTKGKPREDWIAVPVPDPGTRREVVDAAREAVLNNRRSTGGDRFWELSGSALRCGVCGRRTRTAVARKKSGRVYFYYACAKRREGRDACQNRRSHRAEILEAAVRGAVAGLLADPDRMRAGFDARITRERALERGDPGGEAAAWLGRLAEADRVRGTYQEMTTTGLMTLGELGTRLKGLEQTRRTALRELEALRARSEDVRGLERDQDALLELFAGGRGRTPAGALAVLEGLGPEKRHRLYRTLELEVRLGADGGPTVGGILGEVSFGRNG
jgi:site-specific DNA recombinase